MTYFALEDDEAALDMLTEAAVNGHVRAMYALGILLLYGNDEQKAIGSHIISEWRKEWLSDYDFEDEFCRGMFRSDMIMTNRGYEMSISERPTCCLDVSHKVYDVDDECYVYLNSECNLCEADKELLHLY